jgi:hypothetical protein
MKNQKPVRKLGWHRTLKNVPEHSEALQAIYGWLEYQYLECESLKSQMATAIPEEQVVLEEQLAVVVAEYSEVAQKMITDGVRHGVPLIGNGILYY